MSTETQRVDVLANIKDAIKRTSPTTNFNERANLWATHDAVAELIETATAMEQDLAELDRLQIRVPTATRQRAYALRNALARVGGAA